MRRALAAASRVCAALAIALAARATAAAPPDAVPPAPTPRAGVQVRVGFRVVATLRAELLGKSPAERASDATRILDEVVRQAAWGEIHVRTEPGGRILSVGSRRLFALLPGDVDETAGETLDTAVERTVASLNQALSDAAERRSGRHLLAAALLSLVATALFGGLTIALRRLRRGTSQSLERLTERLAAQLPSGGKRFLPLRWLTEAVHQAVRLTFLLAGFVAGYVWLAYVLRRFPYTRPWGEQLGHYLVAGGRAVGAAALRQVPDVLAVAVIVVVTRLLVRLSGSLFEAIESGRLTVSATLAETTKPTRRIVTAVLWIFALIMAYPYLPGSGTDAFKGVSVVLGVMISLGSTTIVGQVFGGFMLLYARVFKVGEFVRIGDVEGTIESQGLFVTKLRTPWDDEVSIPNAVVANATLRNYSRSADPDGPLLATRVTIGYDTPWRQVEALLLLAAERTEGLKKAPPPFVRHWSLSDFYVEYELDARIERPEQRVAVLTALHSRIQDAFNEHGVQIMSPHYWGDPRGAKVVPRERWFEAPAHRPAAGADGR